ncbi:hypothetical protein [Burkholderia vietnamiensis]|uniref:hypothetical protein n=1 Tax=Burkholderia vietnamiensis TaxID=60552 RepID=UPI001CF3E57E|nr:hypothetical protein [Burkholderia vietnamiensis]MCA7983438.1 hypothetical protein [Burkholderia vietnamiensis]
MGDLFQALHSEVSLYTYEDFDNLLSRRATVSDIVNGYFNDNRDTFTTKDFMNFSEFEQLGIAKVLHANLSSLANLNENLSQDLKILIDSDKPLPFPSMQDLQKANAFDTTNNEITTKKNKLK